MKEVSGFIKIVCTIYVLKKSFNFKNGQLL